MRRNNTRRGFTLIELLVVIAIIGLLGSVILASLSNSRAKARDAKRLADMRTVKAALELYALNHNGHYPSSNASGCGGWEATGSDSGNWISSLTADGEINLGLRDPNPSMESTCGNYAYYRYPAGTNGCAQTSGAFYVFGIRSTDLTGTAPYPNSPGWSCPTRNWQGEFSWVTGNFEAQ